MAALQDSRRRTPALAELRTDSMESQCPPSRPRRLESIISSAENGNDFQHEIQQLLVRLGEASFSDQSVLSAAFSDLLTLWKISRQGVLGNLRLLLAELIMENDNMAIFTKTVDCISEAKGCFQGKEEVWRCVKHVLCVMWNCTDTSAKLCRKMAEYGILTSCIRTLSDTLVDEDLASDDNKLFLVKAILGLMHNTIRNCSDCKDLFIKSGCVSLLPKLFKVANPMVKAKALMVTAYLVGEDEHSVLNSSSETIAFIVQVLADSSKCKNHISSRFGMSALEVLKGLNNIAMNEANKVKIVEAGGLKLYTMLLSSEDEDEKEAAALGVWTLAFAAENQSSIIQEPGLVEGLRALTRAKSNASSVHHARGALWEVFHGQERVDMSAVDSSVPHIMISYQWNSQKIMSKVKDSLVQAGFKVWMDVEHMTGSTLEAMALAVERASVVLICMSDKYKASPSCRTESEYVFRLHKDIVPLRLQPGYRPDGWLGILVGARLYFDFSTEELATSSLPKLIKELGHRGKIHAPVPKEKAMSEDTTDGALEKRETQRHSAKLSHHPSRERSASRDGSKEAVVEFWSNNDVVKWLTDHGLGQFAVRFQAIDGSLLLEMRRVRKAAPEFFYRTLQQDLAMDLASALHFSQMLGKLV